MGGYLMIKSVIPVGTTICCPFCNKVLYTFKIPMPDNALIGAIPFYIMAVYPQVNIIKIPRTVRCSHCGNDVNILSQVGYYVELFQGKF